MMNGLAVATLPVTALGCVIYAIWSLYQGLQEIRAQHKTKRRRPEPPLATAVQIGLFVVFSVALVMTGLSIFRKTVHESPYAQWMKDIIHREEDIDGPVVRHLDDLPGVFEVVHSDPAHPVIGASLAHLPATDLDVARLAARCPELTWIHLQNTRITDNCFDSLRQLHALRMIILSQTSIDDQGLKQLGQIPALEELQLCKTQITDKGLAHLAGLSSLKVLDLSGTKVSRRGVRKLKKRLPDCAVRFRKRA